MSAATRIPPRRTPLESPLLSVVMPVYNERTTLDEIVSRVLRVPLRIELVAPAGFGKSTLFSQWVSTIKHPVGWLSLDANDNDPYHFLTYLISAIQNDPNIGQEALEILQSPQNPAYEQILTLLINEISQTPEDVSLILDDYHFINDEQIHKIVLFLVITCPAPCIW